MKAYAQLLESYRSFTLPYMAGNVTLLAPLTLLTLLSRREVLALLTLLTLITLTYHPDAFGVTEQYMDQELCRFIASGRLHAKIDKVR